jgi:hypothetical protein
MVGFVRGNLYTNRETLHAKIKIGALIALDPNCSRNVFIAVVAVIKSFLCFSRTCSPAKTPQSQITFTACTLSQTCYPSHGEPNQ